mgnify:FL=1
MDRTSFVSIAPGIAVRADYCIRAMEDRIGEYDIRLHMGHSAEERRIVLRNCEIGTTRELKIRDIARLPIEQIIRSYHPRYGPTRSRTAGPISSARCRIGNMAC